MNDSRTNRREFVRIASASVASAGALGTLGCFGGTGDDVGTSKEDAGPERPQLPKGNKKTEERIGAAGERIDTARRSLNKYGNCCTAVLVAYAQELGMKIDLAVKISRGMPGLGLTGNVCGAVSGATMVIGLKTTNMNKLGDEEADRRTIEMVRQFIRAFKARHDSIHCRDLLGHDIRTWEKLEAAETENAFEDCPQFVESG
ncbi:MAG: C-GCAxxG-C-C family protein [Planctomycetota bacterium]